MLESYYKYRKKFFFGGGYFFDSHCISEVYRLAYDSDIMLVWRINTDIINSSCGGCNDD